MAETVTGTKWCPKCKKELPRLFFAHNPARGDGLASWCRGCVSGASKPNQKKKEPMAWEF